MNLTNLLLHLSIGQTFITNDAWQCVLKVVETYFRQKTLYLSLENERPPPELMKGTPAFTVSNQRQGGNATNFWLKADLLVVGTTLRRRLRALRGKTMVVVKSEEEAKTFYDLHRFLTVIYILPEADGCRIFAFDGSYVHLNLIDIWKNDTFSMKANLYAKNFPKQKKLHVAVAECSPYLSQISGKDIEGPIERLISTIAHKLDISVQYEISDKRWFQRTLLPNGTISGFLKLLVTNEVDFAVGCIAYTAERMLYAEPVPIPFRTSLAWAVPAPKPQSMTDYLSKRSSSVPMMAAVWGLTVLVIYVSLQNTKSFPDIAFFTWAGSMMQGTICVYRTKWVNAYWQLYIFYSLQVYWLLQILVTVYLSTMPFDAEISSIDNVLDRGLFVHYFEDFQENLDASGVSRKINESGLALPTSGTMNYSLVSETREAVIFGARGLEEFSFRQMYPNVRLSSKVLFLNYQTIHTANFMKRMHPLLPSVRRKSLQIFEAGLFDFWVKNNPKAVARSILRPKKERRALRLDQLDLAFKLISSLGILMGCIVLILEIIVSRLNCKWKKGTGKVENGGVEKINLAIRTPCYNVDASTNSEEF